MSKRTIPDLNLTPLRAHQLLRTISGAWAKGNEQAFRNALSEVEDKLEQHVRYGLRSKRKRS
jgi:hypothetical protein